MSTLETSGRFEPALLEDRLNRHVKRSQTLKPEAAYLLEAALMRGEFERGEAGRITGLPQRTARRVLAGLTEGGLLGGDTEKGPVSLRFPEPVLTDLFPYLYPEL